MAGGVGVAFGVKHSDDGCLGESDDGLLQTVYIVCMSHFSWIRGPGFLRIILSDIGDFPTYFALRTRGLTLV